MVCRNELPILLDTVTSEHAWCTLPPAQGAVVRLGPVILTLSPDPPSGPDAEKQRQETEVGDDGLDGPTLTGALVQVTPDGHRPHGGAHRPSVCTHMRSARRDHVARCGAPGALPRGS